MLNPKFLPTNRRKCLLLVPAVVTINKKTWKNCDQSQYVFFKYNGNHVIAGTWLMADAIDRINVRKASKAEATVIAREIL